MRHDSILKYQFASFLPSTKCVQSHPEGFLPPSAPVGHKSPMQSLRKKSKILSSSTTLAYLETESDACIAEKGYCFPVG